MHSYKTEQNVHFRSLLQKTELSDNKTDTDSTLTGFCTWYRLYTRQVCVPDTDITHTGFCVWYRRYTDRVVHLKQTTFQVFPDTIVTGFFAWYIHYTDTFVLQIQTIHRLICALHLKICAPDIGTTLTNLCTWYRHYTDRFAHLIWQLCHQIFSHICHIKL